MELLLNSGELLNLGEHLQGLTIICQSGTCWLTQAGDPRDYILRNGRQLEIRTKGQVVACAMGSCRLQLVAQEATVRPLVPTAALCSK